MAYIVYMVWSMDVHGYVICILQSIFHSFDRNLSLKPTWDRSPRILLGSSIPAPAWAGDVFADAQEANSLDKKWTLQRLISVEHR